MKIKLTITEFVNDSAGLKCEDGRLVSWPKDKLPEKAEIGDILYFDISSGPAENNAKNILNELLNFDN